MSQEQTTHWISVVDQRDQEIVARKRDVLIAVESARRETALRCANIARLRPHLRGEEIADAILKEFMPPRADVPPGPYDPPRPKGIDMA